MKVLFLYPNIGTELRIPLAISILIASIRNAGHEVELFDTTFYGKEGEFRTDNEAMEKMGTHKPTNLNDLVGQTIDMDPKEALHYAITTFNPDIICVSLIERNFKIAANLLTNIGVPVLVGGILPTIAPEYVLSQSWVDYICVGEGEEAIVQLLNDGYWNANNIITQQSNNSRNLLVNLDDVPEQDWSDFDRRHLLKPFMGEVYKGGSFEFSRGCFKSCTFCVAPKLREVQKGLGCYHRTKTPQLMIQEIEHKIKDYDLQMISFSDTDFLSGVSRKTMGEFLSLYSERVKLPFTIQSGVETLLHEETLTLLRKAQCCAISVGIESGSERIRKEVIKKVTPSKFIKKAMDLCRKHELRVTANYMVGLPYETEEDIHKTISLNRVINPPSIAVTFFTPFMGTELYDLCIKEGFYVPFNEKENVYDYPPLDMPQLSQESIKGLVKEFTEDFQSYQDDFNIVR